MATYNGQEFIGQQLQSILQQLSDNDEIIISDDSSTDDTVGIALSFDDERIKIIPNQRFRSPIFNVENALKHASGDLIFLSDQDDIWLPGKVLSMSQQLEDYDIVVSDCKVVDRNLTVLDESFFVLNNSNKGILRNLVRNSYLGCCMAFKNNVLQLALPFPSDIPMHDIWIGFIGELFYKTYFLNQPLIYYRRHGKNQSPTGEHSSYSFIQKINFRTSLLKYVPKLLARNKRLKKAAYFPSNL